MQTQWLATAHECYTFLRDNKISYLVALICFILIAFIMYTLRHPDTDNYHTMVKNVETLQEDVRILSNKVVRRNTTINQLRLKNKINEKLIENLQKKFGHLKKESLDKKELTETYQRILLGKLSKGSTIIYALEANPSFNNAWAISAILTRFERKKKFNGSFYFEIIEKKENGTRQLHRLPPEKSKAITFVNHLEIEESIALSDNATIVELNLIVLNSKNKEINSERLIIEEAPEPTNR